MSQPLRALRVRGLLPAVGLLYLMLGVLYAIYTPAWQAPDEPAHYNYVRYLADQHRFPVLKLGDYPAAYLEEIKGAHFPPEMSIAPIRYEFHQPPLYYLLVVPIYQLSRGALLPLRLVSVGLGAVLLLVINWTVQEALPGRPFLALGTTAFAAFLPMHLAMTAAANNDILVELFLATILLLSIRYLRRGTLAFEAKGAALPASQTEGDQRLLLLLGITTGLGLLTKSSVYIVPPLVVLAIIARHLWLDQVPPSIGGSLKAVAWYLAPSIGLALPWWLRNMALYGGMDFLGLGRHNQVVVGQLRTAEYVAQYGLGRLMRDMAATSFRSFWGQFGWMGVLLDQRLYQALAVLTALAVIGFALWAARTWRCRSDLPAWQGVAGGFLALWGLFTLASYVWYNAQFVQHQGRYLFRALPVISLAVALGWRETMRRERAWLLAALLVVGAAVLKLAGALDNWSLLLALAAAIALGVRRFLPSSLDSLAHACPYLLLIPLDLACLFLFIVPQLAT